IEPRKDTYDVVVVGGGVAGLSAAATLHVLGISDVLVLEREQECGGAPRHIEIPNFGLREFHRPMTGPDYAARMRARAGRVEIATEFSVMRLLPGGIVEGAGTRGMRSFKAKRVILATGTREASRHNRLVSGARPFGAMTYGTLQRYLQFAGMRPFRKAVIVGTEWVALATVHTMRKFGIRPVCMLEEHSHTTAPEMMARIVERIFRTPVYREVRLRRIIGNAGVEAVEIVCGGQSQVIECDGVVFTGRFIPEAHLVRLSGLSFDAGSGGPATDQWHRLSDPAYFACGNILRPVEASWVCSKEGERAARFVRMSLENILPSPDRSVPVRFSEPIRFVWPQRLVLPYTDKRSKLCLKVSFRRPAKGLLRLTADCREIWARRINAMPEQLIKVVPKNVWLERAQDLDLRCEE
ncbi:MAG: FAD-dependent oxidoreductase, partial [Candidatus Lindowbacteria bacterium]|nr:FAD-dependent oxidoreductase [Candidatus Lindowbacteria bacterium]